MPPPAVGNKSALVRRAALRGALGGLMWSAPVAAFTHLSLLFRYGTLHPADVAQIYLWTTLTWMSIAAAASAARARETAMTEAARLALNRGVRRAVAQASFMAVPVAGFFVVTTWGYGPFGALLGTVMLLGIWLGCAALVGHARGSAEANRIEEEALHAARNADAGGGVAAGAPGRADEVGVRKDERGRVTPRLPEEDGEE